MRRQRHRKERGGSRRRVYVLRLDSEQSLEFSSKTALLHWARQEARKRLPLVEVPWVHLTSRGQLVAHESRAVYERWVTRPRSHRHLRPAAGCPHSLILGHVRQAASGASSPRSS